MESWWGRQGLERMGRGAVGLLAAAWRTGTGPDAGRAAGDGRDGSNGAKGTGGTGGEMPGGSGSDRVATDTAPGSDPDGFTEDGLVLDGLAEDGLILDGLAQDGLAQDGLAEEDRIARGSGIQEQIARGAGVRQQNRLQVPEQGMSRTQERRAAVPEQSRVPSWLATGAAWSWRLLLLAAAIYLISRVLGILYIVVLPCTAAILLTALLQPLAARLRRAGLPNLAATWCTLLIAAAVLGGIVMLVTNRVSADYPVLVTETKHTVTEVESWLARAPFHIKSSDVKKTLNNIPSYLSKHKTLVEGTVVTGGKIAAEFFGGLVLMLFVTFFLLKDGERIWNWLIGAMRPQTARRMDRAGHAGWLAVVYYMRGTVAVAAIHAIVIGLALWIMGAPLVIPLAVLVFLAAFVPLVGILFAGALAILVTLAAKGWVDAVILLCVLVVEDQLEGHLFQPQVVGRVIRLHPLAIILSLAVGGVLAGIPGAVVAVPIVAVITRAVPELRRGDDDDDDP
jgi:predicted PurR-regulated permease PerM